MNYSTDRAIEKIDEDKLGRAGFSQQVGEAIYDYKGKDSLVIGLFGKWGTGKTSVANMALQTVEELSENDLKPPIIIRFDPWNYSDKDNLIGQFFSSLKTNIDLGGNEELKTKVGKVLSDYSEIFGFASLIPIVGSSLATLLKGIAKSSGEELLKPKDLNITKNKLAEALLEVDQKIIVLIDDIDRLANAQIRDIFQLVKQVGDLPNIIYILAMDRDIVKRALSEVHNYDGGEYLEKIIQIPFEIPELRKSKLHSIFLAKINDFIHDLPNNIQWDQQYFIRVFQHCIDPYLQTLRDVNRVTNTFQFRYGMLYEETSIEDMLGITTLEVLEPELYKWIAENKDAVCGGTMHSYLTGKNKPEDNRKQYELAFKSLGLNPDRSIMSVASMFPVFAKDVNAHFYDSNTNTNIRMQMRAAQSERFELYFMLDMDDVKVSRTIINGCIYSFGKEELEKAIIDINENGNITFFIEEIRAMIDKIPYERLSLIASVFIDYQSGFKGELYNSGFFIPATRSVDYLTEQIIKMLKTNDERFELYKELLLSANQSSLGAISHKIRRMERAYGKYTDEKEKTEEQLVSLEQLMKLEQLFLERVKEASGNDTLFETDESIYAFYLWKDLDSDGAQKFINEALKDDIKKLKMICRTAGRWSGSNGSGWSFSHSNYSEYASEEEIYETIQKLDKRKISEFTESDQIRLASFVLNYKKDEFMHVTEKQALQLVSQWKNE